MKVNGGELLRELDEIGRQRTQHYEAEAPADGAGGDSSGS